MSKRSIHFKFKDFDYSDEVFQKYFVGIDFAEEIDSYWYKAIEEVIPRSVWRRGTYKIRRNLFLSKSSYLIYCQGKWYSCWDYGKYDWIHPPYPTEAEMNAMNVLGHSRLSKEASYCLSYWNWYKQIRAASLDASRMRLRFRRFKKLRNVQWLM